MTPDPEPRMRSAQEHYSYAVYADPGMAEQFDRLRFGGPIGALLAEVQEQVLVRFAGPLEGRAVVDVGTGTGRAARSSRHVC